MNEVKLTEKPKITLKTEAFNGEADKYEHLRITDSTEIEPPITVIRINGETISTEGNVTTFSGAVKTGKSALSSVLIAGAIAPGEYDGLEGVEIAPANGKAVLHFDTEQAKHKHQRNLKSTLQRAGLDTCPDNLLSYNIRSENIENYCTITSEIADAAQKRFGAIHLIVIDGGADYVRDVNEPNQSNELVKYFEDLAIACRCPVIVIVHVNPNSDKERGHFGSQLQRKSESILSIKTEGDISFLEPKFLRSAGKGNISIIQFMYDKEKGYHVYCGLRKTAEPGAKDAQRIEEIKKIAGEVFSGQKSYSYPKAIEAIMKYTNTQERTAKDRFKEMKAHEFISKGNDENWRLNK